VLGHNLQFTISIKMIKAAEQDEKKERLLSLFNY